MKRLLALVIVMVLVLTSLTACSLDEIKDKVGGAFDTVKQTVGGWLGIEFPDDEPEEPAVTYDVEAAKDYIYQMMIVQSYETPNDFTVPKQVFIKKVAHDVTWTTDSELVKVVVNEKDVTIDVDEKATEDLVYNLTATINAADGTSATVSFERKVPKYELLTYAQYLEKVTGDSVTIEGIVTLARSKGAGNTRDQFFIQDMNGVNGYYVYSATKDHVAEDGLKVGMKVSVTGIKEVYGQTHEIKDATVTITDSNITTLTPTDITDLFKNNTDPKAADLRDRLGALVTIKGVVIGEQDLAEKSKYLYFEMEGGLKTYVRVYTTDLSVGIMTAEQEAAVFAEHLAKRDYLANVTGVVDVYSDAIYISPVSATPFEYLEKVERTPAEKIDIALSEIELPKSVDKAGEIALPLTGTTYPEVKFAWSSNSDCAAVADGKLTITLPEETTTVTITVKASCEGAEADVEKNYEIKIFAPSAELFVPVAADKVAADKAFKLILNQAILGKTLYFAGDIADVDYRLATTDKADQATDVYLENVTAEGSTDVIGYRLYFFKGETKTYIRTYERTPGEATKGKGSIALVTEAPAEYYTYDETIKTLVVTSPDGVNKYCIGTYSNYDTISCSNASYVNADNVDKSQFPVHLAALELKQIGPVVKAPEADKAFKLILNQATLGKTLYFAGDIADVDYRLATTTKMSQAADVYLEKVFAEDGTTLLGYRLYFFKGETKTYIRTYERTPGEATKGKGSIALVTEAPAEYYTYDETIKTLVVTSPDGVNKYCIGTYSNYDTISCSNASYVNADNVDKSQFPVHLAIIDFIADEEPTPEEPETPDEPEEPAFNGKDVDLTTDSLKVGSSYGNGTSTISGFGFEFIELGNYGNGIQMRTSKAGVSSSLWNTTAFTKGIKTIVLSYNAAKVSTKNISNAIKFTFGNEMGAADYTASLNIETGKLEYVITPDKDTYTFFKLLHTASNSFYFDSIKIYFEMPCLHAYDAACDDTCNLCGATRTVLVNHVYDDDCADTTCNNEGCKVTREAKEHVYDNDCADTTCANCDVTREAKEHVYDNDCADTTCANCAVTREAKEHVYDNCDDTTCANCAVTREAVPHVYDDDCADTTCANCDVTREAKAHVYTGCDDTTCENCAHTREAGNHNFMHECSDKCNECGAANPADKDCTDANSDNKCDYCGGEMDKTGDTPVVDND